MLDTVPLEVDTLPVTPAPVAVAEPDPVAPATIRWNLATRIAFRFCALYFTMYVLFTQMISSLLPLPGDGNGVPPLESLSAVQKVISLVGVHIVRISSPISFRGSGSGDKTIDWLLALTLLLAATIGTTVWSVIDRRRDNYLRLNAWFRLFLRLSLATTLVTYGTVKAIPLQMPYPSLTRLVEPYGNFSPMGVLWYSIGASRPYEMFAGSAELLAAVLLFVPRLATLGALIALADCIQIFTLNMTYDVPVKLFSFHLILMSLVLLAPEASRLANLFIFNRTAAPSTQPPLFRGRRASRIVLALQLVFGAYAVGLGFYGAWQGWKTFGGGAPKPALFGIWNVEQMSIDGVTRSPLLTDWGRWRRVIVQNGTAVSFQRMDDTFTAYPATFDANAKTITLTKPADKNWKATFSFQQPDPERLILDGQMDGHKVRMETRLFDRNNFLLVKTGFRFVQEVPFNR
jgi:hypothetical protein